jgi:hypothetical protein
MYKRAGRFLQVLARKGKKPNRKRTPFKTGFARQMDRAAEKAARVAENWVPGKPGLVKRRTSADPSKSS